MTTWSGNIELTYYLLIYKEEERPIIYPLQQYSPYYFYN